MQLDVDAVRADTPGCGSTIHFNNAGCSLPPAVVVDTVVEYLQAEARTGGYELAEDRRADLDGVYEAACALLGGKAENWAFVESATRAWNSAFTALRFKAGERILTTRSEYPSNMAGLLRAAELQGADIVVVPDDEHGQVDVNVLESMLDDRTRLVSVTHIPTQGGLINPAHEVGALLADTPVLYQLDACQSVGQIDVNVDEIGCDILSFTGRKFLRGPRGTGMVWANEQALAQMSAPDGMDMQGSNWETPTTIQPHPGAARFEPYEVFHAGKVGLAAAIDYAVMIGIDNIEARNAVLSKQLRADLAELPGVTVHDKGRHKSAIVTFSVDGQDPSELQRILRTRQINVSVSSEYSARLDFPERGLTEVVRASVHYFNTTEEIDALVWSVAELSAL